MNDPHPERVATASRLALPRVFWALWFGTLVNRAATFVAPFLMLYLVRDRGVDPILASVVLTLQGIGLALSNLVGGWLADTVGRRGTMIIGLAAAAGIMLLLPEVGPVWLLVVLVTALGLAADLHRPAQGALVADLVPESDRTRAYSLLHWAINLGLSVAMIGGGLIAGISYDWLFRLDAVTTLAFAAIIWRLLPRRPRPDMRAPAAPHREEPATPTGATSPWRDRRLLAFAVITFLVFTIYFQNYVTLPLAVTDIGLSVKDFGLVLAGNGLAVAVLQPLTAGHLGKIPADLALAGAYLLIGVGYGLVAVAKDVPSLAGTVLLWSCGEIVVIAVGAAYVARLAPARARGRYLGMHGAAIAAAAAVAPLAGTIVYRVNSAALWVGCAVVAVLIAAWQLGLRRTASSPVNEAA